MAQNYRNQPNRPEDRRGGRYQPGSEHDRYRTGGEQRFSPEWPESGSRGRGFEGDRGYPQGGYSEEFGYRRGRNRDDYDDREYRSRYHGDRGASGANYQSGRSYGGDYDREGRSRYDEGRFDEGNRFRPAWDERGEDRDLGDTEFLLARDRETSSSNWREDLNDSGGYFGTGSYIDDGDAQHGFGHDFERALARAERERDLGSYRDRERATSGDYRGYERSRYGAESNERRGDYDAPPWRDRQRYEDRSSRAYGAGNEATPSFRGRGPQGYRRSDERLKEMICERLTDDPAIDASEVTVDVNEQRVKLAGTVDTRSTKYEIEELVERFGGVNDIDNQLRVQSSRWGYGQQQTGQQPRGGSDWEAGSSSTLASPTGRPESRGSASGASTTGSPSTGSTGRRK